MKGTLLIVRQGETDDIGNTTLSQRGEQRLEQFRASILHQLSRVDVVYRAGSSTALATGEILMPGLRNRKLQPIKGLGMGSLEIPAQIITGMEQDSHMLAIGGDKLVTRKLIAYFATALKRTYEGDGLPYYQAAFVDGPAASITFVPAY